MVFSVGAGRIMPFSLRSCTPTSMLMVLARANLRTAAGQGQRLKRQILMKSGVLMMLRWKHPMTPNLPGRVRLREPQRMKRGVLVSPSPKQ